VFHAPIITNVAKTMHALDADGPTQITHYFRGIGNDDENDSINSALEGAFAAEDQSVRNHAYLAFLENYCVGDQISVLGFSRGAAAARLFVTDLRSRGLLNTVMVDSRLRRAKNSGESWQEIWALYTHQSKELVKGDDIDISFVGVWDTVATSMGASAKDLEPRKVGHIVHCLALDEERDLFAPSLLLNPRADNVKEVWFPGCHSDIGGGYFHDALGRVTLAFMWNNWNAAVAKQGIGPLAWKSDAVLRYTDTTGLPWLRHSETGITTRGGLSPRVCGKAGGKPPRVHVSVEKFLQHGGLQFCVEGKGFPPEYTPGGSVYTPLAYPGAQAVEAYESENWG
jgi:hypothetical protein